MLKPYQQNPVISITQPHFLPRSSDELKKIGWDKLDILLITGDAYIDHPSFGVPLLGRWLVAHGFKVAICDQPDWTNPKVLSEFPRPKLFAGVSAGAVDSMLSHHTAFRKKRSDDAYTPGGVAGKRPNRATIVYADLVRRSFQGLPVMIGGLEASLRRLAHFDFWTDAIRRSILLDSKADILLYGMSESSILDLANRAQALLQHLDSDAIEAYQLSGTYRKELALNCATMAGCVTAIAPARLDELLQNELSDKNVEYLPTQEEIIAQPNKLLKATASMEMAMHHENVWLIQKTTDRALLVTPPPKDLEDCELDRLYELPFARLPHPDHKAPIPAWEMIRTSITTHRGCGGGCSFCSIALHQGRKIRSRSKSSILEEAVEITSKCFNPNGGKSPKWAGSITDVGGPSANMWQARCNASQSKCVRTSCLYPNVCPAFKVEQSKAIALLDEISKMDSVRHVRIASGVRYDLVLKEIDALKAYTIEYTGGQLKVAPEHICDNVLNLMRKPNLALFEQFLDLFAKYSKEANKEQYVIPYLISAFPGSTEMDMSTLREWLKRRGWSPKQVQCFIPTPGTIATAMFYCGEDMDGNRLHVAKTDRERLRQHHILLGDLGEDKEGRAGAYNKRKLFDKNNSNNSKVYSKEKSASPKGNSHQGKTPSRAKKASTPKR